MTDARPAITRLAPSPTGAMHLGNARTFLVNWALARTHGWRIILRIEDLDTPRTKRGAEAQVIQDLRWLGIDWDEGPMRQSDDLKIYHEAIEALGEDRTYMCLCSRKDIAQAASAPHGDQHEWRYPGTCRDIVFMLAPGARWALRVKIPDEPLTFTDELAGVQTFNVQQQVGDFVIMTKNGLPAYQLAVVVDDARQGVTHIVRGDDLLSSTARQLWLYRLLKLSPLPRYWHLPLIVGQDGRRLAKRHGDTRLAWYRDHGVQPQRIIGLLAHLSGFIDKPAPMTIDEFRSAVDLGRMPRCPTTFTSTEDKWLTTQRPPYFIYE